MTLALLSELSPGLFYMQSLWISEKSRDRVVPPLYTRCCRHKIFTVIIIFKKEIFCKISQKFQCSGKKFVCLHTKR